MLSMLIAYDTQGRVVGTLDRLNVHNANGQVVGLVDFEAKEAAGPLRLSGGGVWEVEGAAGSGTWPEWLGSRVHEFRVVVRDKIIEELVHVGREDVPGSGHRRRRSVVKAAVRARLEQAQGAPADLRDLLGGPDVASEAERCGRDAT